MKQQDDEFYELLTLEYTFKNILRCSVFNMVCDRHVCCRPGDCSEEKPLDDDYVSYELDYHSLEKIKLYSTE